MNSGSLPRKEKDRIFHTGEQCKCKRPYEDFRNEDGSEELFNFECIGYYEDCPWRNQRCCSEIC